MGGTLMASLSYCIDLAHSLHHTHSHTHTQALLKLLLSFSKVKVIHALLFPRFISSALQPAKSSTQLQTESYDSLITAVQTHSLYVHACICIRTGDYPEHSVCMTQFQQDAQLGTVSVRLAPPFLSSASLLLQLPHLSLSLSLLPL